MLKRSILSVLLLVGMLAGHLALASPASAAPLERCAAGPTEYGGFTLESCIYVDASNGRATATVYWDHPAFGFSNANVRLVVTIQRSGVSQKNNNCAWFVVSNTSHGSSSCTAYLPNVAGSQTWRSDAEVYVNLNDVTPTVVRSPPVTES
jgi:hypothetical protein